MENQENAGSAGGNGGIWFLRLFQCWRWGLFLDTWLNVLKFLQEEAIC